MSQHRIRVAPNRGGLTHLSDPDPKWSVPALGQLTFSETLCGRTIPRNGTWTETRAPHTCKRCSAVLEAEVAATVAASEEAEVADGIIADWDDQGQRSATSTGLRIDGHDVVRMDTGAVVARWSELPRPDAVWLVDPDGEGLGMPAKSHTAILRMTYEHLRDIERLHATTEEA